MELMSENEVQFIEGSPGAPVLGSAEAGTAVLEACFGADVSAAVLYAGNLSPAFFDLSSREAGDLLQRLRNYGVRLAIVVPPEWQGGSSRFGEMVAEERRGRDFGIFESRAAAIQWLGS